MTVLYTWNFLTLEKAPLHGELADVVTSIKYTITGHDGDHVFSYGGTAALPPPNGDDFIAFEDITKEWAIEAVEASAGIDDIKAMVESQLIGMKNPQTITVLPPF
jgi:hypothetical protein